MTEPTAKDPLWYKDAVIYQLHVKSFFDANNDGFGDFAGLLEKLDYVAGLGVTTIWLLPFYPSPRRDDGYDIADYYDVSADYGTMADVRKFIDEAHARGLRVITELVINHTSDQHPWFQRARTSPPGSPERDFYVWSGDDTLYSGTRIIFLDTEKSNWTWDAEAGAYFWHRFYSHQPDLNFDNPAVLAEVLKVMHFWLDMGIDGLRLDAIPYLIERDGTSNENLAETHQVLKKIRADLDAHYPDRMLLAEANMWPEDTQQYFGGSADGGPGDECHMAFHFPLMPRMYMAVAQEDRFPITDIMRQTPDIPDGCQWAIFLRNHDELTLEMVTDSERDYLWNTYASDRRARINLGIRRRLAPLMENDRRRIELMNALLLTMPGTPVLYYGDEIGMGDNFYLGDRDGVRTPMQWSPDRNAGFSRANPSSLSLPAIMDPMYGYESVNVETQAENSHSLLAWTKRMLSVRREFQAFGRGTQRFLRPANRKILAYLRDYEDQHILCIANLSRTAQAVELDLAEFAGQTPLELSGRTAFPAIGTLPYLMTLPAYGFYWFRLCDDVTAPNWASGMPSHEAELHTFVLRPNLDTILEPRNLRLLEQDILPGYIAQRRWFQGKDATLEGVRVIRTLPIPGSDDVKLAGIEVTTSDGPVRYAMPVGIAWEGQPSGPFAPNLSMARVRRGRTVGLLTDGFAIPDLPRAVIRALQAGTRIALDPGEGELRFEAFGDVAIPDAAELQWLAAEQSNSSVVIGQTAVLKLLRKIVAGVHPEAEMTLALTRRGFANSAPLLGQVLHVDAAGEPSTLMLLQAYVHNQGDGWQWTLSYLERAADDHTVEEHREPEPAFENYDSFAGALGRRLAEMHAALAQPSDDPWFAPEATTAATAHTRANRIRAELDHALAVVSARNSWRDDRSAARVTALVERADALRGAIGRLALEGEGAPATRIHGDLHLGQVLVAGGDVVIIDFEGEPAKTLDQRRSKDSPARDVAGVLRSFDYAAAVARHSALARAAVAEDKAEELFDRFRRSAVEGFLAGYADAGGDLPQSQIDLFMLEKAAYEINYEAANRPDWIEVPLAGLSAIADRLLGQDRA